MSRPTTFLHLTDLHIGDPAIQDDFLNTDTSATLATVLADIRQIEPVPDFIIASGDLTNRGSEAGFAELKRLLDEAALPIPLILALGNHDTRPHFYNIILGQTDNVEAPYDHDQLIAGVHVVVLDSSVPKQGHGGLEPGQLDWLRGRLDDHPDVPKLVVMHHPPALDDDPELEWQAMSVADTALLADLFKGRTNVLGILCGHLHHDRVSNWYGIPLIMTGGQHDWIDPVKLRNGVLHQRAGVSFAMGVVRPSGLTMSFVPRPEERVLLSSNTFAELFARAHEFYETDSAA